MCLCGARSRGRCATSKRLFAQAPSTPCNKSVIRVTLRSSAERGVLNPCKKWPFRCPQQASPGLTRNEQASPGCTRPQQASPSLTRPASAMFIDVLYIILFNMFYMFLFMQFIHLLQYLIVLFLFTLYAMFFCILTFILHSLILYYVYGLCFACLYAFRFL